MKYRNLIIFIISIFTLILNTQAYASEVCSGKDQFNTKICENYYEIIDQYPFQEKKRDIGIVYDFSWDKNNKKIVIRRDNQNLPIVRFSLFNKDIKQGTSIHKYNEVDLSKVSDKEIERLHKQNVDVKLTLKNNKTILLKPNIYDYNDVKLSNFDLEFINNIDTNKGLLEITFNADFTNKRPELNSLAEGLLGNDLYYTDKDNGPYPIDYVRIEEYKYDVDIRKGINTIITKSKQLDLNLE